MNEIDYKVRTSSRAKRMSLVIGRDGSVTAVKPNGVLDISLDRFVNKNSNWINKQINIFLKKREKLEKSGINSNLLIHSKQHYEKYKKQARKIINTRLEELSRELGFVYKKVSIRNQKARWGSCSSKGNLNFNYKLIFHEPKILDYVIIHELCHIRHMNHGREFWDLVSKYCPNYKKFEKKLKGCE